MTTGTSPGAFGRAILSNVVVACQGACAATRSLPLSGRVTSRRQPRAEAAPNQARTSKVSTSSRAYTRSGAANSNGRGKYITWTRGSRLAVCRGTIRCGLSRPRIDRSISRGRSSVHRRPISSCRRRRKEAARCAARGARRACRTERYAATGRRRHASDGTRHHVLRGSPAG